MSCTSSLDSCLRRCGVLPTSDRAWASLALGTSIHFDCAARTKVLAKVLRRRSLRCQDGSLPRSVMVAGCDATQQDKTKSTQTETHALNQKPEIEYQVMSLLTVQLRSISREPLSTKGTVVRMWYKIISSLQKSKTQEGKKTQDGLCPQYSHLRRLRTLRCSCLRALEGRAGSGSGQWTPKRNYTVAEAQRLAIWV